VIAAVTVRCDDCRTEQTIRGTNLATARTVLRASGWEHTVENGRATDRCPGCLQDVTRKLP
jgi:hypothetical protein